MISTATEATEIKLLVFLEIHCHAFQSVIMRGVKFSCLVFRKRGYRASLGRNAVISKLCLIDILDMLRFE